MNDFYIYKLVEVNTGKPLYIGKGKGKRMSFHLKFIKSHDRPNSKINHYLFYKCKSILNSGGDIIEVKINDSLSEDEALIQEETLIAEIGLDNLCNFSPSGSLTIPPKGTKKYEDYVIKMSEAASKRWENPEYKTKMLEIRKQQGALYKGENHPMYGKTHTSETKDKLSKINTGKKHSEDSIEKTRQKLLGREITWKHKIGKSNKKTWTKKVEDGYIVPDITRSKISNTSTGQLDKILDVSITTRIIELYELFGPNRIRKQLLSEGIDVSLFIIRRELKQSGKYKKFRKSSKL